MSDPRSLKRELLTSLRDSRNAMMTQEWIDTLKDKSPGTRFDAFDRFMGLVESILKLENARLAAIRDRLASNEAAIRKGTARLNEAIEDLRKVSKVMGAVAQGIKLVDRVLGVVA